MTWLGNEPTAFSTLSTEPNISTQNIDHELRQNQAGQNKDGLYDFKCESCLIADERRAGRAEGFCSSLHIWCYQCNRAIFQ